MNDTTNCKVRNIYHKSEKFCEINFHMKLILLLAYNRKIIFGSGGPFMWYNSYAKQKQPWGYKKRVLPSEVRSREQVNDI